MKTIRCIVLILFIVGDFIYAQDYVLHENTSGANMAFIRNRLFSDQVIVKFKVQLIEFPVAVESANGLAIKSDYPDVINTFQSICVREGFLLKNILFYKAISRCEPEKVTVYSPQKRCMVVVPDLSLAFIIRFSQ